MPTDANAANARVMGRGVFASLGTYTQSEIATTKLGKSVSPAEMNRFAFQLPGLIFCKRT